MAKSNYSVAATMDNSGLRQGIQEVGQVLQQAKNVSNQVASSMGVNAVNVGKNVKQLNQILEQTKLQYQQLTDIEKNSDLGQSLANQIEQVTSKLKELKSVQNQAKSSPTKSSSNGGSSIANGIAEGVNAAQGGVEGLVGSLSNFGPYGVAAAAVGTAIAGIGKSAIDARKDIEALDNNFGTLLGSQEKGVAMRKELQKYGATTVYDTKGVAEAAQVMMAYGVSAENVMPVMKGLGDIALGDNEKLKSLGLAFGQMSATGKVAKQDLNQMANAGLGFADIAGTMGISVSEFNEKVSKGEITVGDIQNAITTLTSEGGKFYEGATRGMNGISGAFANVEDNMNQALSTIGEAIEPVVVAISNGLASAIEGVTQIVQYFSDESDTNGESLGEWQGVIDNVKSTLSTLWETITTVIGVVTEVAKEIVTATIKSGLFKDILNILCEVAKIVFERIQSLFKIINRLVTAFKNAYNNSTTFRQGINALITPLKTTISWVKKLVGWVKEAYKWFDKLIGIESKEGGGKPNKNKNKTKGGKGSSSGGTGSSSGGTSSGSTGTSGGGSSSGGSGGKGKHHSSSVKKDKKTKVVKPVNPLANENGGSLQNKAQEFTNKLDNKATYNATYNKYLTKQQSEDERNKRDVTANLPTTGDEFKNPLENLKVPDSARDFKEFVDEANKKKEDFENLLGDIHSNLGGDIGYQIEQFEKLAELFNSNANYATKASAGIAMLGDIMQQLGEDGPIAKMGAVLAAVGQIILGFAQASTQAASLGPWGWLAFVGAGLGAVTTMISTIQGFATGGIVQGKYSTGDRQLIRANAGEMVLTNAQQSNLWNIIKNGETMNGGAVATVVKVRGSDLYLALSNYSKIKGKVGKNTGIK